MKTERYSGGLIRKLSAVRWQAERWQAGERRRRNFGNVEDARRWLEGEQIAFVTRCAPLGGRDVMEFNDAVRLLPAGVSLVDAAKFWLQHHRPGVREVDVEECFGKFMADKEAAGLRGRTITKLRSNCGRFAAAFGSRAMADVSTADISEWLASLKVGLQTRDTVRRDLMNLWAYAMRAGLAVTNPVAGVVAGRWDAPTPSILTPDEAARLMAAVSALRPTLAAAMALCLFAGLRTAEMLAVEWADIGESLNVRPAGAKKRRRRLVPIAANLRLWLGAGGEGRVCPVEARAFMVAREKVAEAAGIEWKGNVARHSWISYRLALVKSADAVALEAGNSDDVIFEHYREVVSEADARRYFEISPSGGDGSTSSVTAGKAEVSTKGAKSRTLPR